MKTFRCVLVLLVVALSSNYAAAQKNKASKESWPAEEKNIAIDSFPKSKMINYLDGWGGMTIAVNAMPKGADLAPLLMGLKNNSCQVPHWGYILEGSLTMEYDDGEVVTLKAGDLFYMSPGHKGKALEDVKLLDFSPESEFKELVAHIEKKAAELQKK